jgi:hypothetical protein
MKSAEVRISIESPSLSEASSLLNLQEENQVRLIGNKEKKQKVDEHAESHSTSLSRDQGVTKRCRLSLLTNSAHVIRVPMWGDGGVAGSQPMSTAVHIT